MARDRFTDNPQFPSFEDYIEFVAGNPNLQYERRIHELREGSNGLGMDPGQLATILQIARDFSLLQFNSSTINKHTKIVTLARPEILGLATLAGLGFDKTAFGRGHERVTTVGNLYPRVKRAVTDIHIALEEYYEIYGRLREFEFLREVISSPRVPTNPDKRIQLAPTPFNPGRFMNTKSVSSESTVSYLARISQYGLRPVIIS